MRFPPAAARAFAIRSVIDLEDNVTVYSGASILGGETVIGQGAVIGSNAFITSSGAPIWSVSKIRSFSFKNRSGKVGELGQEGFFSRQRQTKRKVEFSYG